MINLTFDIVSYISQLLLFYFYILTISQNSQNCKYDFKHKLYIFLCSTAATMSSIILTGKFPLNSLTFMLILYLFFAFVLKLKKSKCVAIVITFFLITIISEIFIVILFTLFVHIPATEMLKIPWIKFAINTCVSSLIFILILIANDIIIHKQRIAEIFSLFNMRYLKTFLYLLLFTIAPQAILIPFNIYNYSTTFLILNVVQLLFTSIFLFWYIKNFLEKDKMQEQVSTLEMDNRTLAGMVDGVRTIKHDFNNIFQAINGYICSEQYDELEKYVLKIMHECNIVNTLSIINKNVFDDPANYGVIGSKYFIATENNITMDLDVTVSFKDINFPMAELSRIFGILLDNSIEATTKCEHKYIRLEIKHVSKKNATVIRVLNTFDQSVKIDLSSIYLKGYSSKKVKSGIGLWEAHKIISKYKHAQIYATIENDKFVQNIIIEKT